MAGAATAPARPRLIILPGAHKTATSHLQQSLLNAEGVLRDRGVALIHPHDIRRDLAPLSELLRDGVTPAVVQAGARGFLDHHARNARTVVLMDENILGSTDRKMLMRKGRLYPWGPRRLARFLALFRGYETQVAIAVRNPASFLPSCWSESLHHGAFTSFDRYTEGVDPTATLWSSLVDRILADCPGLHLTIWDYESYAPLFGELVTHLIGPDASSLVAPDPVRRRTGISQQAADWFLAQPDKDRARLLEARERFPKTEGVQGFVPWTDATRTSIDKCYAKDLETLRQSPHIRFLTPAPGDA